MPFSRAGSRAPRVVGVDAKLVSEAKTIVPGQKFTVALSLKHEEKFHTYWRNPGIVGVATSLTWTLPKGFTAGDIQWQVPEHVKMIGLYNAHGYNNKALLLIDITAPDKLPKGPVTLKAGGAWMSCAKKQCCNLGYQEFSVTLNTGDKIEWNEAVKKEIETARRKLPVPLEGWTYSATRDGEDIILSATNKKGIKLTAADGVYFYANQNIIDTMIDQVISVEGDEIRLVLHLNDSYKDKEVKDLSGLLFHPEGWPGAEDRKYMPLSVEVAGKK